MTRRRMMAAAALLAAAGGIAVAAPTAIVVGATADAGAATVAPAAEGSDTAARDGGGSSPSLRLEVPVIRQAPERCGPAALQMVLAFYGADSAARAAAERAYDPVLRGALITDLARVARQVGFGAEVLKLDDAGLDSLLAAGVPPILLYDRGIGPVVRRHFGVLVATSADRREVTVNDGGAKPRRMGRAALMRRWDSAGSQALVVRRLHP